MACGSLLRTSLLPVVNRIVACCLSKLVIHRFQEVVTSLQITSCNNKFLVCLHGEYNIRVKLCGNTT